MSSLILVLGFVDIPSLIKDNVITPSSQSFIILVSIPNICRQRIVLPLGAVILPRNASCLDSREKNIL